jgi:hypothetical protein
MPTAKHTRPSSHAGSATMDTALKKLICFYEAGVELREKLGMRAAYGKMRDEFPDVSSAEKARKARQFADPRQGYNPREFKEFCDQCRQHGFPVGTAVASMLLRAPKRQRAGLQRKMIENHWSVQRLMLEIHKRFGVRHRSAGQRGRLPRDTDEALLKLAKICNQWGRLCQAIGVREQEGEQKGPAGDIHLSKALRSRVCETDEAITRMWNLVEGRTHK